MAERQLSKEEQILALQQELERLQTALEESQSANSALSERAKYFATADEEVPTGRTVKQRYCKNPWQKSESLQDWSEREVPTYFLKIDLPPVGGIQINIDGEPLQHGQTYEMTIDRVRQIKDIQYRLRAHDAAIHGNDEDTWRPRYSKQVSLKTGAIRNLPANWGKEFAA